MTAGVSDAIAAQPATRASMRREPIVWAPYRLTALALLFVSLFLLLPLVMLLRLSLYQYDPVDMYKEVLTVSNYTKFVTDSFYRGVLWRTVTVAAITTTLCLVGGLLVAYFMSRTRSRLLKRYLLIAILLPLFIGNVVRTAGWVIALDNGGIVNAALMGLGLTSEPIRILYTTGAVIIGLTSVLLPYMIITLHSVMESIDPALEEASSNLGADGFTTFRRIVLPLLMPGVNAGCVLCFILSMNAYATPVLLGGPQFHMMAPSIYAQIAKTMNLPFGAAMACILVIFTLVLTVLSGLYLTRHRHS